MIKSFSCSNFRNIHTNGELNFKRLNILIGGNNTGKTNFIRALSFIGDMLNDRLSGSMPTAFLREIARNGWSHCLNNQVAAGSPIDFSWKFENITEDKEPLKYHLSFSVGNKPEDCTILQESLDSTRDNGFGRPYNYFSCHGKNPGIGSFSTVVSKGKVNTRVRVDVDSNETIMRQFKDLLLESDKLYNGERTKDIKNYLQDIENYFSAFDVYSSARFSNEKMERLGAVNDENTRLMLDGSNFAGVFNYYNSENMMWKKEFNTRMQEIIPALYECDTFMQTDGIKFRIGLKDQKQYDLTDVSEGTRKALMLNMLINMKHGANKVLALDEPEVNLHPAWQHIITEWIIRSNAFEQCFISTHSPDILDGFTEEFKSDTCAIFIFSLGDGIREVKYQDIKDQLGEFELGDLYRSADIALGGWEC